MRLVGEGVGSVGILLINSDVVLAAPHPTPNAHVAKGLQEWRGPFAWALCGGEVSPPHVTLIDWLRQAGGQSWRKGDRLPVCNIVLDASMCIDICIEVQVAHTPPGI
jgi:hypothetical protein